MTLGELPHLRWADCRVVALRLADSPALESAIPGRKSGPLEGLVGTLLLLCSPAGKWINGHSYSVDGGWIMRL